MHEHGQYILEYGTRCDYQKYLNECRRSTVVGYYLARTRFFHQDHLMDSIFLKAMSRNSLYQGAIESYSALQNATKGKHIIQVNTNPNPSEVFLEEMEAYHLSLFDLSVLQRILTFEEQYFNRADGSSYKLVKYSNPSDIVLYHCNASDYISPSETIDGNCFDSNCDTYGSLYHSKAQRAYIFWLEDSREYVVIYHSFWCM